MSSGKFFVIGIVIIMIIYLIYTSTLPQKASTTSTAVPSSSSPSPVTQPNPTLTTELPDLTSTITPLKPAPTTTPYTSPSGPSYIGCYNDNNKDRVFANFEGSSHTVSQCALKAKAANTNMFGMQYWQNGGNVTVNHGECWLTPNLNADQIKYNRFGESTSCKVNYVDTYKYGGSSVNAIYKLV